MPDVRLLAAIGIFLEKDTGQPIKPKTEPPIGLFAEIIIRSAKPEDVTDESLKVTLMQLFSDFYDDARVVDPTLGVPAEREKLRGLIQAILAED